MAVAACVAADQGLAVRRITSRFVLLVATAAILPLVGYGLISVSSLRDGTRVSVRMGNLRVAKQVAEQVSLYMRDNIRVLKSVGSGLASTGLTDWQQNRVLRDYVLQFPEFREITVFDSAGQSIATSALLKTRLAVPDAALRRTDRPFIAPLQLDNDLMPTTIIAVRLPRTELGANWVVGEMQLEELWRMVDKIKVGTQGYALLVG